MNIKEKCCIGCRQYKPIDQLKTKKRLNSSGSFSYTTKCLMCWSKVK